MQKEDNHLMHRNLNMIERVFSKIDNDVLQNNNFQTAREAMSRIANYFEKETSFMT